MQVQAPPSTAEAFVERFATVWADPSPERLDTLVADDVVLMQPLSAPLRGRKAAAAMWKRVFRMSPDLRAEVLEWAAQSDDVVFIRLRLSGTFLRRRATWVAVDRIALVDGRVRERISYFSPLEIVRSWLV